MMKSSSVRAYTPRTSQTNICVLKMIMQGGQTILSISIEFQSQPVICRVLGQGGQYVGFYYRLGSVKCNKFSVLVDSRYFLILRLISLCGLVCINSIFQVLLARSASLRFLISSILSLIFYQSYLIPQSFFSSPAWYLCCWVREVGSREVRASEIRFLTIIIKYSNSMISDSQSKIYSQIREIYEVLLKFGFPGLLSSQILEQIELIEKHLADYFQPTIKRQNLIEWLILNINSLYAQELQSNTPKKRRIVNHLWKLGVLPFSRHTGNLDYEKYVEGLLGYQHSVNLIHTLCLMLKESKFVDKSKQDHRFYAFLGEIVQNFDSLVNLDYDPYKISFPAAYQSLTDDEFNKQYEQTLKKINALKGKNSQETKDRTQNTKVQDVFNSFQQNKAQFCQKYSDLIQKITSTLRKNENLIANYSETDSPASRTLRISQNLPKIYRQYKQKTKLAKVPVSKLAQQRKNLQILLQSLNQTVSL